MSGRRARRTSRTVVDWPEPISTGAWGAVALAALSALWPALAVAVVALAALVISAAIGRISEPRPGAVRRPRRPAAIGFASALGGWSAEAILSGRSALAASIALALGTAGLAVALSRDPARGWP